MATNATVTRYRPALYILAALAAGYTIYYVHNAQQASSASRERRQPLRRRQANNRRRQRPAELEELVASANNLTELADYPRSVWDSRRLLQEWRALPVHFAEVYLLQQRYWSDDTPKTMPLRKRPPPLDVLASDYGIPAEDLKTVRQDYEETVLRTFICYKVPPRCVLTDVDGPDAFAEALSTEPEELMFPNLIKTIILLFNTGAYDTWGLRKDTYKRFNVKPPETRRTDEIDPENWSSALEGDNNDDAADSPSSQPMTPPDEMDIVSESTQAWQEDENDESKREGQTLLNMLYHIAEDQARREGYIHRGVTCNSCSCNPIHGLRYKCINCFDFDLCETCEAMQQHPRTHLFIKIRIPTPSYASTRRPQPLWYPGKTTGFPNSLKRTSTKSLSELSGFTESEVEALWDQFKNLASTEYKNDPLGFGWAIDRETFHKCFALWHGTTPRGRPASLVYDRLFCLYDDDKDGIISFEDFISGMAASKSKDPDKRLKRLFEGFDFDSDGYIARKEVLAIFKACYVLQKERARDYFMEYEVDLLEGGSLRENITSNHPISAAFPTAYECNPSARGGQGKVRNENGDLIINDAQGVIQADEVDEDDLNTVVGDLKEIAVYGKLSDDAAADSAAIAPRDYDAFLSTQDSQQLEAMTLPPIWPPAHLKEDDVKAVLGENVTIADVVAEADRKYVLREAAIRIKDENHGYFRRVMRDEAVQDRADRSQFYLDETEEQAEGETMQKTKARVEPYSLPYEADLQHPTDGPATWDRVTNTFQDKSFRVPPPMPANVGQEILFQVTAEGINELIDPLFRYREDLCRTYCATLDEYYEICSEHLNIYVTAEISALAWFQLQRFLQSFDESATVFTRFSSTLLVKFLASLDQPDSENFKNNKADAVMISTRIKAGKSIPYTLGYTKVIEELDEPLGTENSSGTSAKDEQQPTPSLASDASQPTDLEAENSEPVLDLAKSVRIFNENDTRVEEEIAKQDLEGLLSESGYSVDLDIEDKNVLPTASSQHVIRTLLDLTLPQNRPNNSMPEGKSIPAYMTSPGERQYIPSITEPWSKEFKDFLRFMTVLGRAKEQDEERGGPGRINFEEYAAIVRGRTGPNLEFLGQWIDMQVM